MKKPNSSSIFQSNRYPETSTSDAIQRQLQQLFLLHDSGLDQALIDTLPLFFYKDIMGLKEQFDCAVCLCEFSSQDKLRLLPLCGHAFHFHCIDTWLLSNSTCPLCRTTLFSSTFQIHNPLFNSDVSREFPNGISIEVENAPSSSHKHASVADIVTEKSVFSVRLGKFRSLNNASEGHEVDGETSSHLDARRCYSMGSFQYVVADSDLQVELPHENVGGQVSDGDLEKERISSGHNVDSFSVSKIWLWSKKSKLPSCLDTNVIVASPLNGLKLPSTERSQAV
ncbi:Zinc finger, RING-type [Dillenia turbinata]|uniref:RING-type E3 ubiquitin transferase n=1 Tax=Dillenia turbinata TaxID=194707 RepID=A0AAN8UXM8_9MAGN